MNVTALLLSHVLTYIQVAALVTLRQIAPGRRRTAFAVAIGVRE